MDEGEEPVEVVNNDALHLPVQLRLLFKPFQPGCLTLAFAALHDELRESVEQPFIDAVAY